MHRSEIVRLISSPLTKKVDQASVERCSASLWDLIKKERNEGKCFTMMLPPPNVTGNLHLGHALTVAIQDALIRQRRMSGYRAKWIPGFDHAGLATQSIVERLLLHQQGVNASQLNQQQLIAYANDWKDTKRDQMRDQLKKLGLELDFNKEFFTTDEKSSFAVQTAFIKLFQKGLIYRDIKSMHWSRQLNTTLSDIEVTTIDGVKRYTRTNEVVETRMIPQWYIKADAMARKAVEVVENCSIEMLPSSYKRSWSAWLLENGVHDWCISRQSWWGHKIPAFKLSTSHDVQGNWVVAESLDDAKAVLQSSEVVQDPDVLDTWFSSSLLPLTISGWPNLKLFQESKSKGSFPLDIMETGFDILTFWVSKMVMMSLALENVVPFKLILLHGMICDSEGKKMSKSKGNVIDPTDLIEGASLQHLQDTTLDSHRNGLVEDGQVNIALENQKRLFPKGIPACGADGLRAYLLSQDFQEEIVRVQISQIEKVRRLMNKVWNVTRYVITVMESSGQKYDLDFNTCGLDLKILDESDIKLVKDLYNCILVASNNINYDYQIHHSFETIERFWMKSLSSEYISDLRCHLADEEHSPSHNLKIKLLVGCLNTSIKLLHPFMPHLTEFLHQKLELSAKQKQLNVNDLANIESVMLKSYPRSQDWQLNYDM